MPHLSRRSVLLSGAGCGLILGGGALGFRLVQDGTLPGKYTLATLDGACGSAPPPPRGPRPVRGEPSRSTPPTGSASCRW